MSKLYLSIAIAAVRSDLRFINNTPFTHITTRYRASSIFVLKQTDI